MTGFPITSDLWRHCDPWPALAVYEREIIGDDSSWRL